MSESETKTRPNSLYENDFFTWTQEQARLLREHRFGELDLDNLIDEVESVGGSEKREIRNRLEVLFAHLLKWKFQPGLRGASWRRTIRQQREAIAEIVEASPSLRAYPLRVIGTAYTGATVVASEETGIRITVFPEECPFSVEQTLDLRFLPEDPANE
jgi:hypothetical protein